MVESAPLLREYTLIAYRGFESLSLRQTKKEPRNAGLFFGLAEREGKEKPRGFDKSQSDLDRPPRPEGVKTRAVIAL